MANDMSERPPPKWTFHIGSKNSKAGISLAQRFQQVYEQQKKRKAQPNGVGNARTGTKSKPKPNAVKAGPAVANKASRVKAGAAVENLPAKLRGGRAGPSGVQPGAIKSKKVLVDNATKKRKTKASTAATLAAGQATKVKGDARRNIERAGAEFGAAAAGKKPKKKTKKGKMGAIVQSSSAGLDDELMKHRLSSEDNSGRELLDRQLEDFCREQDDEDMS